ncbi:Nitrogenase (molybdenum-iron)-specific transcriptional regulator NifA [Paramagnetospirillum magnetotacticum MS-1]|uniref:Nif-specific regulatory protein n=1 Tax=Paramagnetospirillum magnetotacticum MS-1 TaxID=272627 RepID=A0A0C2YLK7_PARME|nr:nif-specific transcriptional activator NifA [Paramagnetospirillum magnetotacticum]KIM00675.1 Nitrogenase (molybdenum-iron)-specific transcriptional regulator NifA [Paramagnetospirillum magnetotacticum MS-1]
MTAQKSDESALPLIGIYEISKILGATLDLDKALHDVLNVLASYLNMRHGAVVLKDEAGKSHLAAVTGMSLRLAREGVLKYPFAAVDKVMNTGIPMVVPDAAEEPLLTEYVAENDDSLEDERLSFFCVPIKTTDKPFGALSVERSWSDSAQYVFEHDLRFLTMVATLIGQTASLHRKLANDRETLMTDAARLHKRMAEVRPTLPIRGLEDVVGSSEAMARVFAHVQQAAPTKATILLRGESGTGKELVARAIHILSARAQKPFIKVNCAALSESVLESELFGHEKGAFTGAVAERKGRFELSTGGTLFLDEIGEISANFQAKLLRVLQEGEFERVGGNKTVKVDVRLIAATNRDLEAGVADGSFRADLYYRLNVVPIFLPPLRERSGDIPLLAMYFLKQFNEENGRGLTFSQTALEALQRCYFPGNVRELENCVYRTATMTKGEMIDEMDLSCKQDTCLSSTLWHKRNPADKAAPNLSAPIPVPTGPIVPPAHAAPPLPSAPVPAPAPPAAETPAEASLSDEDLSERERLIQAMERCGWVQAKAARLMGLTPRQIGYALKKHNIEIQQL